MPPVVEITLLLTEIYSSQKSDICKAKCKEQWRNM